MSFQTPQPPPPKKKKLQDTVQRKKAKKNPKAVCQLYYPNHLGYRKRESKLF